VSSSWRAAASAADLWEALIASELGQPELTHILEQRRRWQRPRQQQPVHPKDAYALETSSVSFYWGLVPRKWPGGPHLLRFPTDDGSQESRVLRAGAACVTADNFRTAWVANVDLTVGHTPRRMAVSSGTGLAPSDFRPIVQVAACTSRTLALDADGAVLTWGLHEPLYEGQKGFCFCAAEGATRVALPPRPLLHAGASAGDSGGSDNDDVCGTRAVAVAAGDEHCAILLADGRVFLCGANADGQCAQPASSSVDSWAEAALPDGAGRAVAIALGQSNTAVVTDAGRILVCGCNRRGQVTPGERGGRSSSSGGGCNGSSSNGTADFVWQLTDIGPDARWRGATRANPCAPAVRGAAAAERVVSAAVGDRAIYALTAAGDVFEWGANAATGRPAAAPSKVPGLRDIVALSASVNAAGAPVHSSNGGARIAAAVDACGRLFTWGSARGWAPMGLGHGKSGKGASVSATPREVKGLQEWRVLDVVCGEDIAFFAFGALFCFAGIAILQHNA
jgi:alpha-tubulin suppressor-like RCC1 family protein